MFIPSRVSVHYCYFALTSQLLHDMDLSVAFILMGAISSISNLFIYSYYGELATESFENMSECLWIGSICPPMSRNMSWWWLRRCKNRFIITDLSLLYWIAHIHSSKILKRKNHFASSSEAFLYLHLLASFLANQKSYYKLLDVQSSCYVKKIFQLKNTKNKEVQVQVTENIIWGEKMLAHRVWALKNRQPIFMARNESRCFLISIRYCVACIIYQTCAFCKGYRILSSTLITRGHTSDVNQYWLWNSTEYCPFNKWHLLYLDKYYLQV